MLIEIVALIAGIIIVQLTTSAPQRWMIKAKLSELLVEVTIRIFISSGTFFVVGIALILTGLNLGTALISISVVLGFVLGFAPG